MITVMGWAYGIFQINIRGSFENFENWVCVLEFHGSRGPNIREDFSKSPVLLKRE